MGYPRGQMDKRVVVLAPVREESEYGQARVRYEQVLKMWAWVTWVKGTRAMHHGQMDVYQNIMVRCDFNRKIDRHCRLMIGEKCYVIDSFHAEEGKNEIQMTAFETEG